MPKGKKSIFYPYDNINFNPPAPVLEVSLSVPIKSSEQQIIASLALLDSGADMTVIPENIINQLQLKYVDETLVSDYKGISKKTFVYSVKIIFGNLGYFIIRAIPSSKDYVLIGRDILNKWSLLLKGRDNEFEIN